MPVSRSALYNSEFSGPIVDNLNVVERDPSFNPITSEIIKFTPIGHSPENVVASQVSSSNQELGIDSSPATERAH